VYNVLGAGRIFNVIPIPAVVLLLLFGIIFVVVNYTKLGRSVYAVGGNAEAARLSGINVNKVKIIVMVVVQVCSAISGILVSSQVLSSSANFGKGWEMTAISAVIIGGASLNGGIGRVSRTLVGLIFLGVIINGMTLLNVNEYAQYVVRGMLILLAVLINTVQTQKKI
jgi:ribose/xylose/arabinose/galactoside ABC-type transport system permease subunit